MFDGLQRVQLEVEDRQFAGGTVEPWIVVGQSAWRASDSIEHGSTFE